MERSPTAEGILRGIVRTDGRGQRSDATRNRNRVVRAALEIFAERGMMGTVEQIAERAGVGRATVYRNFPTRDALQVTVATSQFEQIHAIALDAQRNSTPPGMAGGRATTGSASACWVRCSSAWSAARWSPPARHGPGMAG